MFHVDTRILVIDDFSSMRGMMQEILKQLGFNHIICAENGEAGWNAILNLTPPIQLIISDWKMPKMNGMELLKQVRSHQRTAHIPFILITTENETEKVMEAVRAGVSNYIVKPYTLETVKAKLQSTYQKVTKSNP